ncbi:MAG TPA: sulfur carrier protein ThiS [Acidobacteriaceae bacterium]|jgi:sulfur carrier protein
MTLELELNGQRREFAELQAGDSLAALITALELKGDRIAVERNGEIVPRADWPATLLVANDRLEVVHFVGGGTD